MIRYLQQKDKDECMNMIKEFYKTDAVCHEVPQENISATIDAALNESPYAKIIVCEENGKYCGFCTLAFTFSCEAGGIVVMIEEIYIRDEYKGKGFGTKMFEFLRSEFDAKVKRYRLEVTENNLGATRLYEKLGFENLPYKQMILDI